MRSWSWLRSSVLVAVATALPAASSASPPQRIQIWYEVVRDGTHLADVSDELQHADGRYQLVETWKGRGIYAFAGQIVRASRGTLERGVARPLEYTDERTGRQTERAVFDWSAARLTMQRKGNTRHAALPPNAQDRLSFLVALAFAPPKGAPATYSVADGDGISSYVLDAVGSERIKVPAGEFDALKLTRRNDGPQDRRSTELWLAPALGYLAVRIVLVDKDGRRLEQQAKRVLAP